ncbi:Myb-like DNA-binding domain [Musa troglodytarum]|uniref:Myb-like DNA-binding domain n=1 Tax=Musa troglodytarum TaxID=320322 RepID=A0A9E7I4V4_9LILI|nr:Myb-like DNA-binding domain [Musa troglodytarum]URE46153.1 Myb-like DNA-binding domain [Musa troglodytarum]
MALSAGQAQADQGMSKRTGSGEVEEGLAGDKAGNEFIIPSDTSLTFINNPTKNPTKIPKLHTSSEGSAWKPSFQQNVLSNPFLNCDNFQSQESQAVEMQGLDQKPVMDGEEKQRLRTISATGPPAELGLHAKLLNMDPADSSNDLTLIDISLLSMVRLSWEPMNMPTVEPIVIWSASSWTMSDRIWKSMNMKAEQREQSSDSSRERQVPESGARHGGTTHKPWVCVLELVGIGLWGSGWPLPSRTLRNVHIRHRLRPWVYGVVSSAVEGGQHLFFDNGLAGRAFGGVGMAMEPSVKAGPAEEVTAARDDRISRQLEAAGLTVAAALAKRRIPGASIGRLRLPKSTGHG